MEYFFSYWEWFCTDPSVLSKSASLMFSAKRLAREQNKLNGPPRVWAHDWGLISTVAQTTDSNENSTEVAVMDSQALN